MEFAPLQLMLQSLLADRFNLRAHFEERQTQVYALVREGKVDKLTPIKPCSADMTQASAATSTLV
ncbi:MAG: TIGR03435 family protein [Vicinamibacterales bacterium]